MEFSINQIVGVSEMITLCLSNNGVKGKVEIASSGTSKVVSKLRYEEKVREFGAVRYEFNGNKYISTFQYKSILEGVRNGKRNTKIKMRVFCAEGTEIGATNITKIGAV